MNNFLHNLAEVLEVEQLGIDDKFREVPEWCSLKAFGLMVTLENDYGAPIKIDAFLKLVTVRDIYRYVFLAFAAELMGLPVAKLSATSAMGSDPKWDSVMHLRLVMEAEKRFGCAYPLEIVPQLKTIEDFVQKAVW